MQTARCFYDTLLAEAPTLYGDSRAIITCIELFAPIGNSIERDFENLFVPFSKEIEFLRSNRFIFYYRSKSFDFKIFYFILNECVAI